VGEIGRRIEYLGMSVKIKRRREEGNGDNERFKGKRGKNSGWTLIRQTCRVASSVKATTNGKVPLLVPKVV
jgi:hypothetical protein